MFNRQTTFVVDVAAVPPASLRHVSHIVSLTANAQMFWIDAISDMTGVKNIHAVRYLADEHFIRHAMSTTRLAFNGELPIAMLVNAGCPEPTICIVCFNLAKESLC